MSTNEIPYELPYMAHVDKDNVMTITPKSYPELTKEQAVNCAVFHTNKCHRIFGALGAVSDIIESWTRNGKTQTWKTRPNDFRVPVHRGMYKKDQIWHQDKGTAHAATECPLLTMPHTRSKAANEVCKMLDEATEKLKAQIPLAVQRVYENQLSNEYIQLGKGRDIEETCEHPEGREEPCIHDAMIQNSPARQLAADILGIFDTFLEDRNIIIPNDERGDIEEPAAICGSDYYELEDTLTALLEGKAVKVRSSEPDEAIPEGKRCEMVADFLKKARMPNMILPNDGYADGGEPYTEEEMEIINNDEPKDKELELDRLQALAERVKEFKGGEIRFIVNDQHTLIGMVRNGETRPKEEALALIEEITQMVASQTLDSLTSKEEKWRVDVQGVGENIWSSNGLEYPDTFKAVAYARDLYSRWTGMESWRVVPTSTPRQERVIDEHKSMIVDAEGNISKP